MESCRRARARDVPLSALPAGSAPCGTTLALAVRMFTLQTRMSEAFAAQPELRERLQAFHPAFRRLQHPVLGRVLPRLVNVSDAARVAGVDPQALLDVMNLPGPPTAPAVAVARESEPAPFWLSPAAVHELDARPALERGEDPFATIMGGLRTLAPGEILTVLAPFEPAPLRRLLENRGWLSHVTWEGDVCRASFWHPPQPQAGNTDTGNPEPRSAQLPAVERLKKTTDGWSLDVRGLEPPQPLQLALEAIGRGELPLTLIHHREPALLYPRLAERGLSWNAVTVEDHVEVTIRGG